MFGSLLGFSVPKWTHECSSHKEPICFSHWLSKAWPNSHLSVDQKSKKGRTLFIFQPKKPHTSPKSFLQGFHFPLYTTVCLLTRISQVKGRSKPKGPLVQNRKNPWRFTKNDRVLMSFEWREQRKLPLYFNGGKCGQVRESFDFGYWSE